MSDKEYTPVDRGFKVTVKDGKIISDGMKQGKKANYYPFKVQVASNLDNPAKDGIVEFKGVAFGKAAEAMEKAGRLVSFEGYLVADTYEYKGREVTSKQIIVSKVLDTASGSARPVSAASASSSNDDDDSDDVPF